jgi:hypothetical protein
MRYTELRTLRRAIMTAQIVTGTVQYVTIEHLKHLGATRYGDYEYPVRIALFLVGEDGTEYLVRTQVGYHKTSGSTPSAGEYVSLKQGDAAKTPTEWPWVITGKGQCYQSEIRVFHGGAHLQMSIQPTIWVGDRIAVRGSLDGYRIKRAKIVGIERDGQTWGELAVVEATA